MIPAEFYITKRQGDVININRVATALSALGDGTYLCRIEGARKRSNSQNRYFHGPLLTAVFEGLKDAGFNEVRDKEDAKQVIKELFLKRKIKNVNTGEIIQVTKDTHSLTREEMNIFIEEVIRWAVEYLGIVIPYPNEQLTIEVT